MVWTVPAFGVKTVKTKVPQAVEPVNINLVSDFTEKLLQRKTNIDTLQIKEDIDKIVNVCNAIRQKSNRNSFVLKQAGIIILMLDKYDEVENSKLDSPALQE